MVIREGGNIKISNTYDVLENQEGKKKEKEVDSKVDSLILERDSTGIGPGHG